MPATANLINTQHNQELKLKSSKGFTLVELLIVVAIIGALAAISIPMYSKYVDKAQIAVATSTLDAIRKDFESFNVNHQTYPISPIDLVNGTDVNGNTALSSSLLDQIDNDIIYVSYIYNSTTLTYTLRAQARDKNRSELVLTPTSITKAP